MKDKTMNKRLHIMKKTGLWLILAFSLMGCSPKESAKEQIKGQAGAAETSTELEVHFLDVGQGDCTLIKTGEHAMLIDAGNNDKGTLVQKYLMSQGVTHLDYIIGTHPDADHIGGLDVVIYKFESDEILMPDVSKDTKTYEDVIDSAEARHEKITAPEAGETYALGEAEFTIIAPNMSDYENSNDYSIALLLTHGENKFLFAGDAEEESEEEMLNGAADLEADVYKVSHHGSRTATTEEFLQEVEPEYAVISCGEGNSYGHPHVEVLERLQEEDVEVFRTDEQGTIVAVSDGASIRWNMPALEEETGEQKEVAASDKERAEEIKETYIVNKNTKKFHDLSCPLAETMKESNREDREATREELENDGYSPCKKCLDF